MFVASSQECLFPIAITVVLLPRIIMVDVALKVQIMSRGHIGSHPLAVTALDFQPTLATTTGSKTYAMLAPSLVTVSATTWLSSQLGLLRILSQFLVLLHIQNAVITSIVEIWQLDELDAADSGYVLLATVGVFTGSGTCRDKVV